MKHVLKAPSPLFRMKNARIAPLGISVMDKQTKSIQLYSLNITVRFVLKVTTAQEDHILLPLVPSELITQNSGLPPSLNVFYALQTLSMIRLDSLVADLAELMLLQLKELQLAIVLETLERSHTLTPLADA